jgi:phosphatidylinositol alpha-1,6-mannosyltransferase
VLAHRLATGLSSFEVSVVTRDSLGAAEFDAGDHLEVHRVGVSLPLGGRGHNISLNGAAIAQARRLRPAVVLNAHIVTSPAAAAIRYGLRTRTVQYFYAKEIGPRPRLAAFAARHAHASIAISSYTSSLLAGAGVATSGVHLIPPGVDLPQDSRPLAAERPTFLTISRLADSYKGHDVLVRSLALVRAKIPDVEWVVVGDGPLRPSLERLAHSCGVADAVRFLGAVSDEQRDLCLRQADLLAMPSRLPGHGLAGEGFGIVYLEAGAYGKPVVAGNVAGAVDAVIDRVSGLLVDPTDPIAVAEAITELLLNREFAKQLGRAGAERARDFAWPSIVQRVEMLLLDQIERHTGRGTSRQSSRGGR